MRDNDERRGLVFGFLAGLMDGDTDRMRSVLHADATWSVPGSTSVSGVAEGADAIIERARAIHSGEVEIELRFLLEGSERFGALLHNTGRRRPRRAGCSRVHR